MDNHLQLNEADFKISWQEIHPEKTLLLLSTLIKDAEENCDIFLKTTKPSWSTTIEQYLAKETVLMQIWSMYSHLNSTCFDQKWKANYPLGLQKIQDFYLAQALNKNLHKHYQQLLTTNISTEQKTALQTIIRNQKVAGVELDAINKKKLLTVEERLTKLSDNVKTNIIESTDQWQFITKSVEELKGIPDSLLKTCETIENQQKTWNISLKDAHYITIMQNADNPNTRETFFKAHKARASDLSKDPSFDNSKNIENILKTRTEKAKLLGFNDYIEYALQTRAAANKTEITSLLNQLKQKAAPKAEQEFQELQQFALDNYKISSIKPYDTTYLAEKFTTKKTGFSSEELKNYFPLTKVLDGLKTITSHLFKLSITSIKPSTWHSQVLCWQINDLENDIAAVCYLDLFARKGKQGGAWMDECRSRWQSTNYKHQPIAFLNCNFTPSTIKDSLLTHDEVITLFHEFGHVLNHCLSQINTPYISGIENIAWDAVEVASQLLENWCWTSEGLDHISSHTKSQQPLPKHMLDELQKSQQILAATRLMRQITFAEFDLAIHSAKKPLIAKDIYKIFIDLSKTNNKTPTCINDRMPAAFGHIFAGGYAAGYYSYLFSEVLAADAFAKFEEEGLLNQQVGLQLKQTIFSQAAAKPALQLFEEFRGRKPTVTTLLKHKGIL